MLNGKIRIKHKLMPYLTRVSWVLILFFLFCSNHTFFADGVVWSEEAKNATLETVEREGADTVILKFSDGSASRHRLSSGERVTKESVSPSPKGKMIVPIKNFNKPINSFPNAKEIISADYRVQYQSDKLIVVSTKKEGIVSLKLLRSEDLKILKNSEILTDEDYHNEEIKLQLSENMKYLLLSFSPALNTHSYIIDANSFKVIDEVWSRIPPSFIYGGERLSFYDGCVCEGEDNRVLTVRSVLKKDLSITLPFRVYVWNHFDDFRFESDFFWAVNWTGVNTWDLKTLKLHKHFERGCYNPDYYYDKGELPEDAASHLYDLVFVNKDVGYLVCGFDSHLRLFRLTDTQPMLLIDKPVRSLKSVFIIPEEKIIKGIDDEGNVTEVPFKGY